MRSAKIFTEGGPGKGLGHISRCAALASALKHSAWEVQVFLDAPDFTREFFPGVATEIVSWPGLKRFPSNLVRPSALCVFDSYQIDWQLIETYAQQFGAIPLCFDDTGRIEYQRGIVVNGAENASTLYALNPESARYLTGLQFQVMRPAFWNCPPRVDFGPSSCVLLCMGGDDVRSLMPTIYRRLKVAFPSIRIECIASSASRTNSEMLALLRSPDKLHLDIDDRETRRLMYSADFAICGAGQMMYELAVCGLPAAFVQIAENQANNVASWERLGFGCGFLKWDSPGFLDELLELARRLGDEGLRRSQSVVGQSLIDGQGALRVVREVGLVVARLEGE